MVFFDSSATYDSGIVYDEATLAATRTKMIQIKLDLKSKTDAELKQFAVDHIAKMTGNAAFTTPVPGAAPFLALSDAFGTSLTGFDSAQSAAQQATVLKDTNRAALEAALTQRAKNIEGTPGVTEVQVLSTGFSVRSGRTPNSVPGMVANLSITTGDSAGELDLQWDPMATANHYEAQLCAESAFATGVTNLPSVTKSKAVATGLTSGSRMWARVRATNAAGPGAWSDPATKIVP